MNRKLGRKSAHRRQTLKNLSISLLIYEKINTTSAKAKETKALVEKYINLAKKNSLASKRLLLSRLLNNKTVVDKLTHDLSKRFKDQQSGYVRLFKTKPRLGDNASMTTLILSKSKFLNNLEKSDEKENKTAKDNKKSSNK